MKNMMTFPVATGKKLDHLSWSPHCLPGFENVTKYSILLQDLARLVSIILVQNYLEILPTAKYVDLRSSR